VSQPTGLQLSAANRKGGHYLLGVPATAQGRFYNSDREQATGGWQSVAVETYGNSDPGSREGVRYLGRTAGGEES
jgi:hypothetical protein